MLSAIVGPADVGDFDVGEMSVGAFVIGTPVGELVLGERGGVGGELGEAVTGAYCRFKRAGPICWLLFSLLVHRFWHALFGLTPHGLRSPSYHHMSRNRSLPRLWWMSCNFL